MAVSWNEEQTWRWPARPFYIRGKQHAVPTAPRVRWHQPRRLPRRRRRHHEARGAAPTAAGAPGRTEKSTGLGDVRVHDASRIDQGRSGIDADCNAERFGYFFLACTRLDGGVGMRCDAAVAAQAHRNRQRNQFTHLGVQLARLAARIAQRAVASDRIGTQRGDLADRVEQLRLVVIPVKHHDAISYGVDPKTPEIADCARAIAVRLPAAGGAL